MGARPYQPGFGRFLAPDPILAGRLSEEFLFEPQRLNPYGYALNSPRSLADPSGELVLIDDALFWAIGKIFGRKDGFLEGTFQNLKESWSLLAGTFNTFNDVDSFSDVLWGLGQLFLRLTWSLPNEVLGLTFGYFAIEIGGGKTSLWQNVQKIQLPGSGAFTLGSKVIGNSTGIEAHEQGHYKQNLLLGPTYLFIIAIPSVSHFYLHDHSKDGNYDHFYTEKWAEAWK